VSWPGRGLGSARRRERFGILVVAAGVGLAACVAAAGLLVFRGGQPGIAPTQSQWNVTTPPGTGVVARIAVDQYAAFSWAPDGAHLLVASQSGSRVYDRFGKLVSQFGGAEGWLDAGHLIGDDGSPVSIDRSRSSGPSVNAWVVANGHGSAAIIVAVPACVGDPIVNWYRDGRYERTQDKVSPFGWSPDGRLALLGHFSCESMDAELHGWKGPVEVADFASGRVLATAPAVRGEMAFSPDLSMLAAQSDADLEIVDLGGQPVETLTGTRFLGWLDSETLYAVKGSQLELVDLDPLAVMAAVGNEWQAESPTGLHLAGDLTGVARRLVAQDGTTLMDLSSAGLAAERYPTADEHVNPSLQQSWWSPDGRMLALKSSDGSSLYLLSVDPAIKGSL
jgi:hypothetical protein